MAQNFWSPYFTRSGGKCGNGFPAWLYQGSGFTEIVQAKLAFFNNADDVQDQYTSAWTELAGRYANNPLVVGAEMLNEPYVLPTASAPQDLHLDAVYTKVGSAIRTVNPRILLFFMDTQFVEGGSFGLSGPPPLPNVVYEFHIYGENWAAVRPKAEAFWQRAREWGVPAFMGEFNAFKYGHGSGYVDDWQEQVVELLNWAKTRSISWSFQAYKGSSSLIDNESDEPRPDLVPALQNEF